MTRNKTDWKNEPGYKAIADLLLKGKTDKELVEIKQTIKRCERKETRINVLLVAVVGGIGAIAYGTWALVDWLVNGVEYPDIPYEIGLLFFIPLLIVSLMSYKYGPLANRIDKELESRILEDNNE